jgi:hypothetical protein
MSDKTKPIMPVEAQVRRRVTGLSFDQIKRMDIQVTVATGMMEELRRVCLSAQTQNMALMPDGILKWIDDCMGEGQ